MMMVVMMMVVMMMLMVIVNGSLDCEGRTAPPVRIIE